MKDLKEMTLRELLEADDVHFIDIIDECKRRRLVIEAALDLANDYTLVDEKANPDNWDALQAKVNAYRAAREVERERS